MLATMRPENYQELPTSIGQPSPPPPGTSEVQHGWKKWLQALTPRYIVLCVLDFFTPEILSRRKGQNINFRLEQSKTAWLDGLRGWAALLVCVFHLTSWTHAGIDYCYGATLPSGAINNSPAAWPLVRTLWTGGHFSVALFFTISGYVLPRRLISLLHSGRHAEFVDALHSSVVRRPFRLLLPVVFSTLAITIVTYLSGIPTSPMKRQDSMPGQLMAWLRETLQYLYFFNSGYHVINDHTWSLLVEMRGSMSLFVWLFALSRTQHTTRLYLTLALIWYLVFAITAAQMATFFAGMLTAELDFISSGSLPINLPWDRFVQAVGRHGLVRTLVSHAALAGALYLGSSPFASSVDSSRDEVLGNCAGWATLEWLIPEAYAHGGDDTTWLWFWLFWAAWIFLLAAKEIAWLRRALSGSFSQCQLSGPSVLSPCFSLLTSFTDLGRVSFPLYLTHGPMIALFSRPLLYLTGVKRNMDEEMVSLYGSIENKWYDASWFPFTDHGPYALEPNYLFCLVSSILVFLYVAELGVRSIEGPSIRLSKLVYGRYFRGD